MPPIIKENIRYVCELHDGFLKQPLCRELSMHLFDIYIILQKAKSNDVETIDKTISVFCDYIQLKKRKSLLKWMSSNLQNLSMSLSRAIRDSEFNEFVAFDVENFSMEIPDLVETLNNIENELFNYMGSAWNENKGKFISDFTGYIEILIGQWLCFESKMLDIRINLGNYVPASGRNNTLPGVLFKEL